MLGLACIKIQLKKTRMYQFKKCYDEYVRYRSRQNTSFKSFVPIYHKGKKMDQIELVLKKVKVDSTCRYGYFYSLDERIIPFAYNHLIDNMPFDYSVVLENSLNEMRIRNPQLIDMIINYLNSVSSKIQNVEIRQRLLGMIEEHPETLRDALQRILFWNQLLWQTGNKLVGLGRLDKMLDKYELNENDLVDFLNVLHMHYNYKSSAMMGDTGQIIVLGGGEESGNYFNNDYTRAFIRIISDLHVPDPKILLRVSESMPNDLLQIACSSIATGCGSPLLSNDDVVIPALKEFVYKSDAYNYGVSACWEPLIIGKSLEQNNLFDIEYSMVFESVIQDNNSLDSYQVLLVKYKERLKKHLEELCVKMDAILFEENPIMSVATYNCWKSGIDISQGGAIYNNYGLLSVGLASAIDSLLNIKNYVYEEKKYTYEQVRKALISNYLNEEGMKEDFSLCRNGFGSNCNEAVRLTNEIIEYVASVLSAYRNRFGGRVKFGLSSPAYVNAGRKTPATADGRCAGEPFSTHISKRKLISLTDIVEFAGNIQYNGLKSNGNVVDLVIQPTLITDNLDKFVAFISAAIRIGFFQMQFNVLTYEQLVDAKKYPEKYPDLIVRVWGFSADFNDLPDSYKDVLISRAKEGENT